MAGLWAAWSITSGESSRQAEGAAAVTVALRTPPGTKRPCSPTTSPDLMSPTSFSPASPFTLAIRRPSISSKATSAGLPCWKTVWPGAKRTGGASAHSSSRLARGTFLNM